MMLDSNKLKTYIANYYGFGNWNSKIWFIGMEEGGGNSLEEVQRRLESWHSNPNNLIDNKAHHQRIGLAQFFEKGTPQKTWWKLIRFKLSLEEKLSGNHSKDIEMIRDIQKNSWGRLTSDNALLDLFPLPSPGEGDWLYGTLKWTDIDYLQSRFSYKEKLKEKRTQFIKDKIKTHRPKVVVFYSKDYTRYWNEIAECDFNSDKANTFVEKKNSMTYLSKDNTCYVLVPQPSYAWANSFWDNAGIAVRKYLQSKN